jgi:hypothetical protein
VPEAKFPLALDGRGVRGEGAGRANAHAFIPSEEPNYQQSTVEPPTSTPLLNPNEVPPESQGLRDRYPWCPDKIS